MGVCGSKNDGSNPSNTTTQPPAAQHPPRQRTYAQGGASSGVSSAISALPENIRQLYNQVCPTHPDHQLVERDVVPLLTMRDPNNVNYKYTYLYKVDDTKHIGNDIKKTYQYASRVPLEALKKKREEFWGN